MLRRVVALRNFSANGGSSLLSISSISAGSGQQLRVLAIRQPSYPFSAAAGPCFSHVIIAGHSYKDDCESQSSIAIGKNRLGILRVLNAGANQRMQVRLFASSTNTDASSNLDIKSKVKTMWKNYGVVAITTYLCVYLCTLSSVFLSLDYDIFNAASFGLDPAAAVQKVCDIFESVTGSQALPSYIREHPKVGTFAIAWVMTKFTEPLRLGFTLATVPQISKWLGRVPPSTVEKK